MSHSEVKFRKDTLQLRIFISFSHKRKDALSNQALPDSVKSHLPAHAQGIYREAFNHAWEEYANPSKHRENGSREETTHRVAWAAVKEKYEKQDDSWVKKKT